LSLFKIERLFFFWPNAPFLQINVPLPHYCPSPKHLFFLEGINPCLNRPALFQFLAYANQKPPQGFFFPRRPRSFDRSERFPFFCPQFPSGVHGPAGFLSGSSTPSEPTALFVSEAAWIFYPFFIVRKSGFPFFGPNVSRFAVHPVSLMVFSGSDNLASFCLPLRPPPARSRCGPFRLFQGGPIPSKQASSRAKMKNGPISIQRPARS